EPTCPLQGKTLSRRPRYDHFGTSPSEVAHARPPASRASSACSGPISIAYAPLASVLRRHARLKPSRSCRRDRADPTGPSGCVPPLRAARAEEVLHQRAAFRFAHAGDDLESMIVAGEIAAAHRRPDRAGSRL